MTKKRELARHKSELEVRVREAYHTMSSYLRMHRGCLDDALALQDGSLLEEIRKRGKLTRSQLMAWHRYWYVRCASKGSTGGMTSGYEEYTDKSSHSPTEMQLTTYNREDLAKVISRAGPHVYLNSEAVEHLALVDFLRFEERGLIEQLTRDYIRAHGSREVNASTTPTLGMVMSGYVDNRQAIAAGVSRIQALLNSIAQFYRYPVFFS